MDIKIGQKFSVDEIYSAAIGCAEEAAAVANKKWTQLEQACELCKDKDCEIYRLRNNQPIDPRERKMLSEKMEMDRRSGNKFMIDGWLFVFDKAKLP